MDFKRGLIAMLVLALAAAAIAGCGGDDDDTTGATTGGNQPSEQSSSAGDEAPESGSQGSGGQQGSGDRNGDGGGADGSRFVQQAGAICEAGRQQLLAKTGQLGKELGDRFTTKAGEREVTRKVAVPEMEKQIEALSELTPPPAREQQVEAFLAAWRRALNATKEESRSLIKSMSGVDDLARQAGLEQCAYG